MNKNKKVIVRLIIVVMLLLFVPIPLHLKDGGTVVYRAVLYKLTKYHKIAMDTTVETEAGTIVESGHHVGWGIEFLGMEIFNNTKYVPDSQNYSDSLENISITYTLEDAKKAEFVCFENGDITEGHYESVKDEYPVLYIQELTYKNSTYTIRWIEEGEMITKTYKYMLRYEGEPNSETALFDSYVKYVLTNDSTVTWDQIERGIFSSQLGDGIDHYTVYNDWIYKNEEWGITLTAENVTPTSATIKCTQSGGEPTGELQTGSRYILETWTQEYGWREVLCYAEVYWTAEAWLIPKDRVTEWEVEWEWLCGSLSEGTYRIGKEITDFRDTGDYDTEICYAEFEIVE